MHLYLFINAPWNFLNLNSSFHKLWPVSKFNLKSIPPMKLTSNYVDFRVNIGPFMRFKYPKIHKIYFKQLFFSSWELDLQHYSLELHSWILSVLVRIIISLYSSSPICLKCMFHYIKSSFTISHHFFVLFSSFSTNMTLVLHSYSQQ